MVALTKPPKSTLPVRFAAASGCDPKMPCYFPIPAWRNPGGVLNLREPRDQSVPQKYLRLPCGSCIGCRTSRAREWSLRCSLELQSHQHACWTTLTYDDKHLPPTLVKAHLSGWLKRLRARVFPTPVRFFASGEYGERTHRAHYHAILFGLPQRAPIQSAWPYGYARTDPLTPASIAYVAGYCSKKLNWKLEAGERLDPETGELYEFQPPFIQMSRNPGIAGNARKHWSSWRTSAIYQGSEIPVPRFLHNSWLAHATPSQIALLDQEKSMRPLLDHTKERLMASNLIALSKHSLASQKRTTF